MSESRALYVSVVRDSAVRMAVMMIDNFRPMQCINDTIGL
jgi:hypothetical protein